MLLLSATLSCSNKQPNPSPDPLTEDKTPAIASPCRIDQDPARDGCLPDASFCLRWPRCEAQGLCLYDKKSQRCQRSEVLTLEEPMLLGWYYPSQRRRAQDALPCLRWGRCQFARAGGLIATPYSCKRWIGCTIEGRCDYDPRNKRCRVESPSFCRSWAGCRDRGRCQMMPRVIDGSSVEVCGLVENNCKNTRACREQKRCKLNDDHGSCEGFLDTICRASASCTLHGRCSFSDETCRAMRDEDCRASRACKQEGLCMALRGQCVKPARVARERCDGRGAGEWEIIDGRCRMAPKQSCAEPCKEEGRCQAKIQTYCDGGGLCSSQSFQTCVTGGDVDCAQSEVCKQRGLCKKGDRRSAPIKCRGRRQAPFYNDCAEEVVRDVCVLSSAWCARQPACKQRGYCNAVELRYGDRRCFPSSHEDCAQSEDCKTDGLCAMTPDPSFSLGRCVPSRAEHCRRSRTCRKDRRNCIFDAQASICR